ATGRGGPPTKTRAKARGDRTHGDRGRAARVYSQTRRPVAPNQCTDRITVSYLAASRQVMDVKQITILSVAALLILGAFFIYNSGGEGHGDNNANFPDGTYWICSKPDCKHEFNLSMKALSDHHEHHYGDPIPCPKCGTAGAVPASLCPHCRKIYRTSTSSTVCPHCQKDTVKSGG
ncbi:MAG: hypothetical protein WD768_17590, partial [Phycisphaeraceae bacterium]